MLIPVIMAGVVNSVFREETGLPNSGSDVEGVAGSELLACEDKDVDVVGLVTVFSVDRFWHREGTDLFGPQLQQRR